MWSNWTQLRPILQVTTSPQLLALAHTPIPKNKDMKISDSIKIDNMEKRKSKFYYSGNLKIFNKDKIVNLELTTDDQANKNRSRKQPM